MQHLFLVLSNYLYSATKLAYYIFFNSHTRKQQNKHYKIISNLKITLQHAWQWLEIETVASGCCRWCWWCFLSPPLVAFGNWQCNTYVHDDYDGCGPLSTTTLQNHRVHLSHTHIYQLVVEVTSASGDFSKWPNAMVKNLGTPLGTFHQDGARDQFHKKVPTKSWDIWELFWWLFKGPKDFYN